MFHFLNARITFGNINGVITPAPGVHSQPSTSMEVNADDEEGTENHSTSCSIDLEYFDAPSDYVDQSVGRQHTGEVFVFDTHPTK